MGARRMPAERATAESRVLLLAPTERDGQATVRALAGSGIACEVCPSLDELCARALLGAAVLIVPEELVLSDESDVLAEQLSRQPVWSDLPVIVLTRAAGESLAVDKAIATLGNVSLIERPMRVTTLLSVVRAAVRARERQYQLRDHLEERERLLASEQAARAMAEASADEARRASEAKSEFLATLSHELRTPLTPVLLNVSLMEAHPALPEDLRADIEMIRRNIELESRLISDLLDLTRISKGKLRLDKDNVDLHAIVLAAIDICQREASARLVVDLSATRHTVRGDATRLQQIFWNLVNNAEKFTGPDGTITVRSFDTPDDRICVQIIDTGAGIDPAVLPRLFSAFEQGDVRAQRQQAGLGLGLAISRKLVEAHRGTISAASEGRGRGATFTVDLPLAAHPQKATAPPRQQQQQPAESPAGAPLNVLLVEDHEPTLRALERLLRQTGHRVTGVTTVSSATAAVARGGFDLIISDLGLPDGSGLDVIRQLRSRYDGPAIALTGYGMDSDITASRSAGFNEHLTKPVDLATLQAAIHRVTGPRTERVS